MRHSYLSSKDLRIQRLEAYVSMHPLHMQYGKKSGIDIVDATCIIVG